MYGDAVQGDMSRGDSEATALNKAFIPALAGAASTYLLTAAGGAQGMEALLRQPAFKPDFRQWFKAVIAGSVKEDLREEAPDQLIQGIIERYTYNPDKPWKDIIEETLQAGIGGALLGGAVEATTTGIAPSGTNQNQPQPLIPPNTTTADRPSTPPLSVEQSQKLIHNVMNRPPEQRGHPTTQADLAQAQWVLREQVRKLESQKEPQSETQEKALADAKAALARVGAESGKGPTSQPITDDKSNAPAAKWIVPQQPHHLKPSMPYDANRKPRGSPKKLDKKDIDSHNERGVNGENEAANVLAQHGYDYEQIREANKSPDGKVSGVADKWDTYAPHAGKNMRGIRDFIVDKVDRQNAPYVVIRLEPNGQDVNDIAAHLKKFPIDGLKQLFVIKNGQLYILY